MGRSGWGLCVVAALMLGCGRDTLGQAFEQGGAAGANPAALSRGERAGLGGAAGWLPWRCLPPCRGAPLSAYERHAAPNPIPEENEKPGDPTWHDGLEGDWDHIELYASVESAEAGDLVGVKVSTRKDEQVTADLYRIGYYGGAGARRVWHGGPFNTHRQERCPRAWSTGRLECQWEDTFAFTVGDDWVSGIYVVRIKDADGYKRFTPLVIRDHRAAELLFQPAFNTYQAYNPYGGEDLYDDDSGSMPSGRAHEASYDRPYLYGEGLGQLMQYEYWMVKFIEKNGYDVTYGTNLDFSRFQPYLDGIGALVIAGHDEYWSQQERDQVDSAIASGGTSFVHFGGNGGYWRVRPVDSFAGQPLRAIACYKNDVELDPIPFSTIRFRDAPNPQPESLLFGSLYDSWQLVPFPMVVTDPGHWLFEGTGVTRGTRLQGLVGYEFDRVNAQWMPPGLSISAESPLVTAEGVPSMSQVVDWTAPSGRLIFSAGTIFWSLGLSADPAVHDGRLERMTLNVLERALGHRRPPRALPPASGPIPTEPAPDARWAASVAAVAGAPGAAGWVDGPAEQARFSGPTGLALTSSGLLVVADTGNNRIRLVSPDGDRTVTTLAGTGVLGFRNGDGAQAMFRAPNGVAVGPDGAIYVADSDNHVIRRIENNPPHWTVSTWAGGPFQAGFADGPAWVARFNRPTAVAVDAQGNVYVADQEGNRIRMIAAGTRVVTTLAGKSVPGHADAARGPLAWFNNPSALALGPSGELYVFDTANGLLRRISAGPERAVTTLAGQSDRPFGFADGTGQVARFRAQMGLAVCPDGTILLADTGNFRLREVLPGADAASTRVYTLAGSGSVGTSLGSSDVAELVAPAGVVCAPDGRIFVSDSYNNTIRAITR